MPGEIVGIVGPNGAGKTTLLRMIAGALEPDDGTITARGRVGWLPEDYAVPSAERVRAIVGVAARLGGGDPDAALAAADLEELSRRPFGRLSKGQRQRVGLAAALALDPSTILLDEPGSGLDPGQLTSLSELISDLALQGRAVVVATHVLADAAGLCDRVVFMRSGSVAAEICGGSVDHLTGAYMKLNQ